MAKCRSCGATIRWVKTAAGKPMPLDPEADPERGNVRLAAGGPVLVLGAQAAADLRATGYPLYLSHHVSCPQGEEWRR